MSGSDESVQPSEQRGGSTPDAEEIRKKGSWAGLADEGVVPAEEGGSDAPDELLGDDPELGSEVLGQTTGSDEPATEDGIDLAAGENADATTDGGRSRRWESSPTSRTSPPRSAGRTPTRPANGPRGTLVENRTRACYGRAEPSFY